MLTKNEKTLADIIRQKLIYINRIQYSTNAMEAAKAGAQREVLLDLVTDFTLYSRVDRREFLRACGLIS